jgi:hypothetical protein
LEKIKTLPFLLITRKILSYLAEKPDKNQTTTTPPRDQPPHQQALTPY